MIREALDSLSLNEAKAQFWDILKDEKNVTDSGSKLSRAPELDVSFYGRGASLNYGMNTKGTIYIHNGQKFATRFNSVKELEIVYFQYDGDYSHSEYVTTNMLFKKMKLKKLPYQIINKAITTIANTVKDKQGNIIVQFKNGAEFKLLDSYDDNKALRAKMLLIDGKIFKLEQYGFKVNKIKQALKILEPEIYNKRKVSKFTRVETLDEYLEMNFTFGFQDTGGITGEGIEFYKKVQKDKINLSTQAGHSFYGEWTKYDIDLKVPITKDEVEKRMKKFVEYKEQMQGRHSKYGKGLADWVRSTGGHHGNPVWMD